MELVRWHKNGLLLNDEVCMQLITIMPWQCFCCCILQLLSPASDSVSALWCWHCHSWCHPVLSWYVKLKTGFIFQKLPKVKASNQTTTHVTFCVFQELTVDIMKGAPNWQNICSMDYMEEISWIWNMSLRSFLKKCWMVGFQSFFLKVFKIIFQCLLSLLSTLKH